MSWMRTWNERYQAVPEDMRFGLVVAAMVLVGAVNMLLTIHAGFPFGLLLLAAILFVGWVRLTYVMETPPAARGGTGTELHKLDIGWLYSLNRWYDTLPEDRQFWVVPVVLILAGFINMLLTVAHAFPFGLLFLFVVLALVAIRVPYDRGWLREPPSLTLTGGPAAIDAPAAPAVTHATPVPAITTTPASEPAPAPVHPHPQEPPATE